MFLSLSRQCLVISLFFHSGQGKSVGCFQSMEECSSKQGCPWIICLYISLYLTRWSQWDQISLLQGRPWRWHNTLPYQHAYIYLSSQTPNELNLYGNLFYVESCQAHTMFPSLTCLQEAGRGLIPHESGSSLLKNNTVANSLAGISRYDLLHSINTYPSVM